MFSKPPRFLRPLVLNLGGTINADWRLTEPWFDPGDGITKTITHPWRDARGRLPVQVFIEDFLGNASIDHEEISDKDSKFVTPEELARMHSRIGNAHERGHDLIIIVSGTDNQVTWAQEAEDNVPALPIVWVGAMRELTWDMDDDTGLFLYDPRNPDKKLRSDGWKRLVCALQHAPREPGSYIEVNGRFEPAHNVYKDYERQCFATRSSQTPASAHLMAPVK